MMLIIPWSSFRFSVILDCGYPKIEKSNEKADKKIFHHDFTDEKCDAHISLVISGGNNNKIKNILLIFSLVFLTYQIADKNPINNLKNKIKIDNHLFFPISSS